MPIVVNIIMGDLSFFVDIEKFYNLRKVSEHKEEPCDIDKLKAYISESLEISDLILEGKVAQGNLFLFPHMLSDRLFNQTGYESEQIVYYITTLNNSGELDDECTDLIIREAYAVEKSKKECFEKFDKQMQDAELRFQAEMEAAKKKAAQVPIQPKQNPLDDKALMKMAQMGFSIPGMPQGALAPPVMGGMPGMMPGMGIPGMKIPGTKKATKKAKKKAKKE